MVNMQATSAIGGLFFLSHLHDGERLTLMYADKRDFLSHLHDGELFDTCDCLTRFFLSHLHDGELMEIFS